MGSCAHLDIRCPLSVLPIEILIGIGLNVIKLSVKYKIKKYGIGYEGGFLWQEKTAAMLPASPLLKVESSLYLCNAFLSD